MAKREQKPVKEKTAKEPVEVKPKRQYTKRNKAVEETKAIVDAIEEIVEQDKNKIADKVLAEITSEPPASIAPIEEPEVTKEETKAPVNPDAPKAYSDRVFTILGDNVAFLAGNVTIPKGYTVQRIGETTFKFDGFDFDGQKDIPVSQEFDFGVQSNLFQTQLEQYESGLGITTPNKDTAPAPPADLAAAIANPPSPTQYSVDNTAAMEDYAGIILNAIMNTPVVRMGRTIPVANIEKMLQSQSTAYAYKLNRTPFGQYYVDMSQGNKVVRIPKNETEFLPVG